MREVIGPGDEQEDHYEEKADPKFVVGESGTVYESTTVPDDYLGTADHIVNK